MDELSGSGGGDPTCGGDGGGGGVSGGIRDDGLSFLPWALLALLLGALSHIVLQLLKTSAVFKQVTGHSIPVPPFTVVIFFIGVIAALLNDAGRLEWTGEVSGSLKIWTETHPNVVLFLLMPPIIFEEAFKVNWNIFIKVVQSSLVMAIVGVLLHIVLMAACAKVLLPLFEVSMSGALSLGDYSETVATWPVCFLIGTATATTDPGAALELLEKLGAPQRLTMLIAGESLLNDGTTFVFFMIFKNLAGSCVSGDDLRPSSIVAHFSWLVVASSLFGAAAAAVTVAVVKRCAAPTIKVALLITASYGVYFVAGDAIGISGVLAIVVFGIRCSVGSRYCMDASTLRQNRAVWQVLAWLASTGIFMLSGIMVVSKVISRPGFVGYQAVLMSISMYICMMAIRALTITMLYPILSRTGYSMTPKEGCMLCWCGLRGAVSLSLALLVELDPSISAEQKELVFTQVAGAVTITLLINAPSAGWLYKHLGIYANNEYSSVLDNNALRAIHTESRRFIDGDLQMHWFHKHGSSHLIKKLLPNFKHEKDQKTGERRPCRFTRGSLMNVGLLAPSTAWLAVSEKRAELRYASTDSNQSSGDNDDGGTSPRSHQVHIPDAPFTDDELQKVSKSELLSWLQEHASTIFLVENHLIGHISSHMHARETLVRAYGELLTKGDYCNFAELDRRNARSQVHQEGEAGHLGGHKLNAVATFVGAAAHHLHLDQKVSFIKSKTQGVVKRRGGSRSRSPGGSAGPDTFEHEEEADESQLSAKVAMLSLCLRTIESAICVKQELGMIGPQAFQEIMKAIDHGKDEIGLQNDAIIEAVWLKIRQSIEAEDALSSCLPPLRFRHLLVAAEMLYSFLSAVYLLSKHDYQMHWHLRDNVGTSKIESDEARMRQAFDEIDADGSGALDRAELLLFARKIRPEKELGDHELLAAMELLDETAGGGGGAITFEAFQGWWRRGGMAELHAEQEVQEEISNVLNLGHSLLDALRAQHQATFECIHTVIACRYSIDAMRELTGRYFNQGFIGLRLRESIDEVVERRERALEQYFHSSLTAAALRTVAHAVPWLSPDPLLLAFVTDAELRDNRSATSVGGADGNRESFLPGGTPRGRKGPTAGDSTDSDFDPVAGDAWINPLRSNGGAESD
jgi:NhaP-type Na+/H+ or K+/H+ antiporter